MDCRCRQQPRDEAFVRRAVAPLQSGRELPGAQGLTRGDHLLIMFGNVVPLWETMQAAIKLGVVADPASLAIDARPTCATGSGRGRVKVVVGRKPEVAERFDGVGGDQLVRRWSSMRRRRRTDGSADEQAADSRSRPSGRTGQPARDDPTALPLLHLRHHGDAQDSSSIASALPRRPPVDDVLARGQGGRHPSEYLLAGLGQARLELALRAVECGGDVFVVKYAALLTPRRSGGDRT